MKRTATDAGLPQTPPQSRIPGIPVPGAPTGSPSPAFPAISPPTIATALPPPAVIWPQPGPAFFTFSANQAYPLRSPGLPVTAPTISASTNRLSVVPNLAGNQPPVAPSRSTGRYSPAQLAGKTELTIKLAIPADLIELADTLRRPTTVTKIILVTRCPTELKNTLQAISSSQAIRDLEIVYNGPIPSSELLEGVLSLQQRHAPLKSFRLISTDRQPKNIDLDQRIFDALFALPILEQIQFSGPPGRHSVSVIVDNADRLTSSLAKHNTLKSVAFERIGGAPFITAVLKGAAGSAVVEELRFDTLNLTECSAGLQGLLKHNAKLRSLSLKRCQLGQQAMTGMLELIQRHPTLELLDVSDAKIPATELVSLGEPIGKMLATNHQLNTLRLRCPLSSMNIAALATGLHANTHLTVLDLDLLDGAAGSETDLPEYKAGAHVGDLFASNKGLREVAIRLPEAENHGNLRLLEGLAQNSSIESLTIENPGSIDRVVLLTDSPRIKHLTLKMPRIPKDRRSVFTKGLCYLADKLSNNTSLLSFSLIFHPDDEERRAYWGDGRGGNVNAAIRKIEAIAARNQLLSMARPAAVGVSVMLDLQRVEPMALPTLPAEVNQLLLESVAHHLPLHDAKKVFEAVLPYAS